VIPAYNALALLCQGRARRDTREPLPYVAPWRALVPRGAAVAAVRDWRLGRLTTFA